MLTGKGWILSNYVCLEYLNISLADTALSSFDNASHRCIKIAIVHDIAEGIHFSLKSISHI